MLFHGIPFWSQLFIYQISMKTSETKETLHFFLKSVFVCVRSQEKLNKATTLSIKTTIFFLLFFLLYPLFFF